MAEDEEQKLIQFPCGQDHWTHSEWEVMRNSIKKRCANCSRVSRNLWWGCCWHVLSNNDETESWLIFRTTLTRFILTLRHGLKRFQNRQVFDIRKIKDVVIEKIGTLLFSELQKYFPFEDLRIMFKILTISLENLQLLEPLSRTGL